ncbi:MAG: hypothetical protein ACK56I_11765, partial [bacterium]
RKFEANISRNETPQPQAAQFLFLGVHKSEFLCSEKIRKFPAINVFYLLNAKASCVSKVVSA